jgi:AcrR family transcriptional regulator
VTRFTLVQLRKARQARTREALLDAAARVFARRGYAKAGLEEIAEEAGYSTGAVYSNFSGKDELFLTMVDRQISRETEQLVDVVRGAETVEERLRVGAAQWMDFLRRDPDFFLLIMEFWARAVRTPELAPRYVESREQVTGVMTRMIEQGAADAGLELPLTPREMTLMLEALGDGLALRKLVDAEAVPDDLLPRIAVLVLGAVLNRPAAP